MHDTILDDRSGLAIVFDGKRIPLKWHRLRRSRSDPLFDEAVLDEGLKRGASMEVDLRVLGDGGFAVLHDETLDRETDGTGRVAACTGAAIGRLHYAGGGRRVLLAEDLAARLASAHPQALLQLDMKDDFAQAGERGVARLAALFAEHQQNLIVSGDSTELTLAIAERLPDMRRGLEPSFRLLDLYRAGRKEALAGQLESELRGPLRPHVVYLSWKLVLAADDDGIDLIRICHAHAAKVDVWTFNPARPEAGFTDAEWRDFSRLLALGADQVTTDEALALQRAHIRRSAGQAD